MASAPRRALAGVACPTVGVYLATSVALEEFAGGPAQPRLPVTPRAWFDAYEAAAIDNPGRVCSELFAPQLAGAYGKAVQGSCRGYFRRITSFSVVRSQRAAGGVRPGVGCAAHVC